MQRILNRLLGTLLALLLLSAVHAAEPATRAYDIPADDAESALKTFSQQSGKGVIAATDLVQGVRTNAVKGDFTAAQALDQMLSGTGLIGREDRKSGTFAVRRETALESKNAPSRLADATAANGGARIEGGLVRLQNYEVTGVRDTGVVNQGVIPREENQAVRYLVWNRQAIEQTGATSLPEFFRQMTAATNAGTGSQQTFALAANLFSGVGSVTDTLDLRGFGSAQTLVMLNGRRLYGSESEGPDLSRIPLAAVERIEILPTSGSAIYGAQAVGGVVNIVLRQGYNGTEVTTFAGVTTGGGAEQFKVDVFQGRTSADGRTRVSFTASFDHREALRFADRPYYERALGVVTPERDEYFTLAGLFAGPRALVINNARTSLGIPGSTAAIAAVPSGASGSLTPADFTSTAGNPDLSAARLKRRVLSPGRDALSLYANLEHEFVPRRLSFYADTSLGYALTRAEYPGYNPSFVLSASNPANPFRTNVTPGFTGRSISVFADPTDLPDDRVRNEARTFRVVAGLKGAVDDEKWKWAVDFSWGREEYVTKNESWMPLLGAATNAGLYNPFRDYRTVGPASAATRDAAYARHDLRARPMITATNWRLNGSPWEFWGGPVLVSGGAELRFENQYQASSWTYGSFGSIAGANVQDPYLIKTSRRAGAAYAEFVVPFVGERNRRPFLHTLDLNGAMRFEKYDDFGSAAPPMLALKYAPSADFALRGSYSEGFQPPTQSDLYADPIVFQQPILIARFLFTDRARQGFTPIYPAGGQLTQRIQGNAALKPETSENLDLGFLVTPRWAPGLTVNASYFRYDKRDVIAFIDGQQLLDNYPQFFTRGPNLPTDPAGVPGPIESFVNMPVNVSRLIVSGWDFDVNYRWTTATHGTFVVVANGTYNLAFKQRVLPSSPAQDIIGQVDINPGLSAPLRWRGNLGLRWQGRQWGAGVTAHYTHHYSTNDTTPTPENEFASGLDGESINAMVTLDARISYAFPAAVDATRAWRRWLAGSRLSLSVLNLCDTRPPYTSDSLRSWYSLYQDPRQRFISLEWKKEL